LPPHLHYIYIGDELCARVREEYDVTARTLALGLSDIRLVEVEKFIWQVHNKKEGQRLELWNDRRTELAKREWCEWAGCEEALWPDVF
jgi:hypothetical protein